MKHLLSVTVVGEEVWGGGTWGGNLASKSQSLDAGSDSSWGRKTLKRNQISGKTSDVWASHRGTRNSLGSRGGSNPCREDRNTWSKDIKNSTEVGEGGAGIVDVGGTDGDGIWSRSWGDVGGVLVLVSGSDDDGDASGDGGLDGGVEGGGEASSERHGEDGLGGETEGLGVGADPLDTGDHTGVGSRSSGIEDLDGDESGLLGDSVGRASDGAGAVGAVSVLIGVGGAGDEVLAPDGAAAELGVGGVDASVDDIDAGAGAGGGVVDVLGRALQLVGDAAETPWGAGLGGQGRGVDLGILLDVCNLFGVSIGVLRGL